MYFGDAEKFGKKTEEIGLVTPTPDLGQPMGVSHFPNVLLVITEMVQVGDILSPVAPFTNMV